MKRLVSTIACLLTLLVGCAHAPSPPALITAWASHPRVLVSAAMTVDQVSMLRDVVKEWSRRSGWLMRVEVVTADDPAVNGLPPYGVIGVSSGGLHTPWSLGSCDIYYNAATGHIHSVDLRVSDGEPDFAEYAHEFGHALGFDHSIYARDVMLTVPGEHSREICPGEDKIRLVIPHSRRPDRSDKRDAR